MATRMLPLLLFAVATTFLTVATAQGPERNCKFPLPDKTKPTQLQGENQQNGYSFVWSTDVDKEANGPYTFRTIVKNTHGTAVLPMKWERASIEFDELFPARCGFNKHQSSLRYKEIPETELKYGSRLEHNVTASVYVASEEQEAKPDNKPKLTSEIWVNMVGVVFVSEVLPKKDDRPRIRYGIANTGSELVEVSMAQFVNVQDMLLQTKAITIEDEHFFEKRLILEPGGKLRSSTMMIDAKNHYLIAEKRFVMTLHRSDGGGEKRALAKGIVSAYIPVAK